MEAFLKGFKPSTSGAKPVKAVESKPIRKKPVPWVEKYRPKTVSDVASQQEVVAVLKKTLQGADLPNLLFYGPPGTGKTSTILALSREMFGDMYKSRILELNASDERGIQVVREKIKTFSQLSASGVRPDGTPCPPFKIVILDEADSMTSAAQAALRRTMEKESKTTRFCLICNYVSRIIDPLTSRCSKFRFKPLDKEILLERLEGICQKEEVSCEPGVLNVFIDVSEGDLRKAITLLQSTFRLRQGSAITAGDVSETAGVIPDDWIERLFEACHSSSYDKLQAFVKELIWEGYTASQLILQVHDYVVMGSKFTDKQKCVISEKLAVCDHRLLEGADEYLQILDLTNVLMEQICRAA